MTIEIFIQDQTQKPRSDGFGEWTNHPDDNPLRVRFKSPLTNLGMGERYAIKYGPVEGAFINVDAEYQESDSDFLYTIVPVVP